MPGCRLLSSCALMALYRSVTFGARRALYLLAKGVMAIRHRPKRNHGTLGALLLALVTLAPLGAGPKGCTHLHHGHAHKRHRPKRALGAKAHFAGNDLPWQCVIAKRLPLNDTGKVDVTRIQVENTPGRTYSVVGVEREGALVDIRLAKVKGSATPRSFAGVPKKVRKEKLAMMRDMAKAYSPDYLPQLIELFGPDALEGIMDGAQPQAQGDYTATVPFPFLPMLYASRDKDTDDELRGGLNVPKTINSIMRLLFHASSVAHDFEK